MFHILIVEDDKDLNKTVCKYLSQQGYEAVGCLNAEDAYDVMYKTMFDLLIIPFALNISSLYVKTFCFSS